MWMLHTSYQHVYSAGGEAVSLLESKQLVCLRLSSWYEYFGPQELMCVCCSAALLGSIFHLICA